jgi:S-adenosylmethionine/arginine decarboxylase-like enzyme
MRMRHTRQPANGTAERFVFGMELIMDIAGCDVDVITDPASLRTYASELVDLLRMKKFGETWLHHFGHAHQVTTGYTMFQAIETSSIVVHVSEGPGRVHANVFSCREFDTDAALEYSEKFFGGSDTTYSVLHR